MISEKYVDQVIYVIEGSTIKKKELKDDLIDHFCCLIEIDMKKGIDFDTAFRRAQDQTAPNGLDEIQQETIFLLNYKRIIIMKKLTYLIGCLGAIALSAAFLFRILNIGGPLPELLGFGGAIALLCLFLPLSVADRIKHLGNQVFSEKVKWIMGIASALLFGMASVFKVMHLQGAVILLGLSFIIFGFGFLPFLFFRMYKKSVEDL